MADTFNLVDEACPDCTHRHAGAAMAYICIGCPCERREFPAGPGPERRSSS